MNVGIITTFNSISPAYSLNRVVQDQIKMLVQGGYKPTVVVAESFKSGEAYDLAELARTPNVNCSNSIEKDKTFDEDVEKLVVAFEEIIKPLTVIITHDIIYQPAALKHNFALRRVADKYPEKKWLHWIHSATSPYTIANLRPFFQEEYLKLVQKPFPNSLYISFNNIAVPSIARNFGVEESQVKVVPHPIDLSSYYGFDPITKRLFEEKNIFEAEAVCMYPVRLDRGKQVEHVIKTMAMLKEYMSVRVIINDFHSTGGDKVTYREQLINLGIDWGLTTQELTFTSQFDPKWGAEIPWEHSVKMMQYSNVYIHPSVSETYSLSAQEAGVGGAVLVLNQDFPPMRDIYGPMAIYKKYSSNWDLMADLAESYTDKTRTNTEYGPGETPQDQRTLFEKQYHKGTALKIAYHLKNDPSLAMQIKLRTQRNLKTVFKQHLEPLFYG